MSDLSTFEKELGIAWDEEEKPETEEETSIDREFGIVWDEKKTTAPREPKKVPIVIDEVDPDTRVKMNKIADTMQNPEEEKARIDNALLFSEMTGIPAKDVYDDEPIFKRIWNMGKEMVSTAFRKDVHDAWYMGEISAQINMLSYQQFSGDDSEETQRRIEELEAQMPEVNKLKYKWPGKFVLSAVDILPPMLHGIHVGQITGIATGLTALAISWALHTGPHGAFSAPGTFLYGYGIGQAAGSADYWRRLEAGAAYYDLKDLRDDQGNPIDRRLIEIACHSIGLVNSLIEVVKVRDIIKTIPGGRKIFGIATRKAVIKLIENGTIRGVLLRAAARYGKHLTVETLEEISQEIVNIVGEETLKEISYIKTGAGREMITRRYASREEYLERAKEVWGKHLPRIFDVAREAVQGLAVLGFPGAAISTTMEAAGTLKKKTPGIEEKEEVEKREFTREEFEEGVPEIISPEVAVQKEAPIEEREGRIYVNEAELEKGAKFTIGGKQFQVTEKTPEGTVVKGKTGGELLLENFDELEIDEGSLERTIPEKPIKIVDVARDLQRKAVREYKQRIEEDLVTRIEEMGRINPRYFKGAEEIETIPKWVQKKVFTDDQNAIDLDEAADRLGMSDDELIQKLQIYEPIEKPPTIKSYVEALTKEYGTPIERLLVEAEEDKLITSKTRSTLRKAYALGKKEAIEKEKQKHAEVTSRKAARTKIRERLNKVVQDLRTAEKKTKKMYPEFAIPISNLLEGIDLVKRKRPYLLRLYEIRKYFENNPDAEISEAMKERLDILDKRNLNNITLEELEDLHKSVMHYVHLNKTSQEIRVAKQQMKKELAIAKSISEMKPEKRIKDEIVGKYGGLRKKIDTAWKDVKTFFGLGHMHYDLIVELLSGPNSTMHEVFYKEIKEGTQTQLKYRQDTFKKFWESVKPILEKHKIKNVVKWLNEEVQIGKLVLTRNKRMALYRHSLLEDNRETLTKGGFGLRKEKDPNKVYSMSEEGLNAILESLTPAELEFAGEPIDTLYDEMYMAMNKIFIEKNGYELPKVERYYRKDVMPAARSTDIDIESETAVEKFKGQWMRIGINKGMLKERKDVRTPIYLNGLTYDINHSVMNAAAYVGLELPLSNSSKLLYDRTFKGEFLSRYGRETYRAVEQGLRDIAGEWKSYGFLEEKFMRFRSKLTTAALGLNPFVMLKQPLSYGIYLPYVKPKYLVQGTVDYIIHPKQVIERNKAFSPEFLERTEGGFSRDVAEVMKVHAEKGIAGHRSIQEMFMKPIQWFDLQAVAPGMNGAVLQVLDELKEGKLSREVEKALDIQEGDVVEMKPEDKIALAYRYADYVTERTQPMFSPEHMSPLQRGGPAAKFLTMFSSSTNQFLNLFYRSWNELMRVKDPAALKKFAWVVFSVGFVNTAGVMAIDELRDRVYGRDDEDKMWLNLIRVFSGYFYILRDVMSSIVSKIERGTFSGYDIDIPITRFANIVVNAVVHGYEMAAATSRSKRQKAALKCLDDSVRAIMMSQGVPYDPVKKMAEAVIERID